MNYSDKYLKYKNKYLELKNSVQTGGAGFEEFIDKPIYYKRISVKNFIQPLESLIPGNGSYFIFIGDLFSDPDLTTKIGTTRITYSIINNDSKIKEIIIVVRLVLLDNKHTLNYEGKVTMPDHFGVSSSDSNKILEYILNTTLINSEENKIARKLLYNIDTSNQHGVLPYGGIFTLIN
jgi:hypothetical protein